MIFFTCTRYDIPVGIRPENIASVEYETTDVNSHWIAETVITLVNGEKFHVKETPRLVEKKLREFRSGQEREIQELYRQIADLRSGSV